jgi:hypothetical protein
MSDVKVNPCNKCWKEPEAWGYAARDIMIYYCCGDTGWMSYPAWQAANPLAEKPLSDADNPPKADPLPPCWCGEEWEFYRPGVSIHPNNECVMFGTKLADEAVRFLFGQNPRVKELEALAKKLKEQRNTSDANADAADERCLIAQKQRDALQAKLDAIPADATAKLGGELAELHWENYQHLRTIAKMVRQIQAKK